MSDTLTISLLGSSQVTLNGRPLRFGSVKAIALLAYLSVSGMLHDRAELAALLWPESDNKRARGALRYTLSRIKKELGDDFLLVSRRQIGMNPQADWTADVVTLRRLLAPALGPGDDLTDETVGDVEKGVALYHADFLQGFSLRDSEGFYEWSFIQGEALRRNLATALKRLAAYHQEQAHPAAAVAYAHRWLNLDSLHEPVHCQLMQLYADSGEWTAVHNQYQALADLLEIAHSPLNLNLMQTAFNGDEGACQETPGPPPPPELVEGVEGVEVADRGAFTRDRLFDQYVQRMFRRQEAKESGDYASAEVSGQLTWLARRMQRHNHSIFLIEQLQPSWLQKGRSQWVYLFLAHVVMPAVFGMFIMWSFIQLIGINPPYIEIEFVTRFAAFFGIVDAPWNALFSMFWLNFFAGMLAAIASGLFFLWRRRRRETTRIDRRLGWLQLLLVGGIAWMAVTIPISTTDALPLAIFLGSLAALGQVLTSGGPNNGQSFRTDIRIRGTLKWSWRSALMLGAVGAALSLIWSGIIWLTDPSAFAGGLNMLNMGLLFFLLGGLSDKRPEIRSRPNEGMRIAGRNGVKAALVVALPAMILTALTVNVASGLYTGLMLGLFAGVVHGFNDVGKHSVVRLLLWREGRTPLNYARLLDCAADCVLLQRVGGGYTFRHRLLQDYFADKS